MPGAVLARQAAGRQTHDKGRPEFFPPCTAGPPFPSAGSTNVGGWTWIGVDTNNSDAGSTKDGSAEGTPMQELRLVAVSEDGTYAVLAVPGRGGRFSLPIDDRLRTVARGQFSRLAQYEIEVENPLRPKEIQDRIRAGETAEEIADAAGIPIDRVRRFEGPVLAEREYRAQEAQRSTVRGHTESGPGPRLGEVVTERLSEAGALADSLEWDSRKRSDGSWQVHLQFTIEGRPHEAEWVFDPRRRQVMPADDLARRLCLPQADWPDVRLGALGAPTATVTSIGSRLHHAEPDRRGGPRPSQPGWSREDEPARSRETEQEPARDRAAAEASRDAAAVARAGAHAARPAEPHVPAPAPAPAAASAGRHAADPAEVAASQPAAAHSASNGTLPLSTAEPTMTSPATADGAVSGAPVADAAATGTLAGDAKGGGGPAASAGGAAGAGGPAGSDDGAAATEAPAPEQRPARPSRKSARARRSSVPSWDEIMLGTSRQPD
jgi:hypothetical protein